MVKKVALSTIIVMRDNKAVEVKPGDTFDFTRDEMKDFESLEQEHVDANKHLPVPLPFRALVRDPINELHEDGPLMGRPKTLGVPVKGEPGKTETGKDM